MATYYKYLSFGEDGSICRDRTMSIFRENKLYMPFYHVLNDPMEAYYEASSLTASQIQELKSTKQAIRICCLSKSHTDMLMWSHYGDGHKGCCIEVEVNPISSPACKRRVIKYVPNIQAPQGCNSYERSIDILRKKLLPWQYEQEVRFLRNSAIDNDEYLKVNIKKVYLGCHLEYRQVEEFTQLINGMRILQPHIDIEQLQRDQLTYWKNKRNPNKPIL